MNIVDSHHYDNENVIIVDSYTCTLNQTDLKTNKNKFYIMQVTTDTNKYYHYTRYGRIGEIGKIIFKECSKETAISNFKSQFKKKTGNVWNSTFERKKGKYFMSVMKEPEPESDSESDSEQKDEIIVTDKRIKYLLDLISDVDMLKNSMTRLNIDTKKMPLGRISDKQIESAKELLIQLLKDVQNDKKPFYDDVSSEYYTLIPYSCGRNKPPIIDSEKIIEKNLELLDELKNIAMTVKINKKSKSNKYDNIYTKLETTIKPLGKKTKMYSNLTDYVMNTHCPTHNLNLEILDIYEIKRDNEDFNTKLHNKTLLFHGSPLCNWCSIMKNGLYLDPSKLGVRITGKMFGYGIYWANAITKSFNYCGYQTQNNIGIIAVGEVALGDCHQKVYSDYNINKKYLNSIDKHSTHGMGLYSPNKNDEKTIRKTILPSGKLQKTNEQRYLWYDEFVIYDTSQYKLKYLLVLKNK
jgi:poly [ADP-ribose] polymerase